MKVFYIVNMNINRSKGGLFLATYERLKGHSSNIDCIAVNNNYYDGDISRLFKRVLYKKESKITKLEEISLFKEIKINNLNYKKNFFYNLKGIFKLGNKFDNVVNYYSKKYYDILKESDIIHAHWGWPNGYIAYKLSAKLSIPYFITFHGSDINYLDKRNYPSMLLAMENAYKCFFVSNKLLENAKSMGYSGKNAIVTYNGVDIDKFQLKMNNNDSVKTVGFIGALIYKKGVDLLPEIFNKIRSLTREEIKFIIVGDGNLANDLKEQFGKYKDLDVTFIGDVEPEEIPFIMKQLDVLVVPSRNEGLGMVILEANATGVPVVGTRVGGIPEAIGNDKNIIEFADDLTYKMSLRVFQLLQEKSDRYGLRERILKEFSWTKIVEEEYTYYIKSIS